MDRLEQGNELKRGAENVELPEPKKQQVEKLDNHLMEHILELRAM